MDAVKDVMLNMMLSMMPAMMPVVQFGAVMFIIGLLALLLKMVSGSGGGGLLWAGRILVVLGVCFIIFQFAGMWLGTPPSIRFGTSYINILQPFLSADGFDFANQEPFWRIGLAFLVPGIIYGFFKSRSNA